MAKTAKKRAARSTAKMPLRHGYGWAPDLPDHRDFLYSANLALLNAPRYTTRDNWAVAPQTRLALRSNLIR
jgi:hypothetical protein